MNKYNLFFKNKKLIACFLTALLGCEVTSAQIKFVKSFQAQHEISAFDNTTFCVAYLSQGNLMTLRDTPITITTN